MPRFAAQLSLFSRFGLFLFCSELTCRAAAAHPFQGLRLVSILHAKNICSLHWPLQRFFVQLVLYLVQLDDGVDLRSLFYGASICGHFLSCRRQLRRYFQSQPSFALLPAMSCSSGDLLLSSFNVVDPALRCVVQSMEVRKQWHRKQWEKKGPVAFAS